MVVISQFSFTNYMQIDVGDADRAKFAKANSYQNFIYKLHVLMYYTYSIPDLTSHRTFYRKLLCQNIWIFDV